MLNARVPGLPVMLTAALLLAANAGEAAAAVGGGYSCSVQSSDVVVPSGGEASIVVTVAYNVTRLETVHVSMEPVAGFAFTSGRFVAWPAGAKSSTGNLTVTNTDPGVSSGRTAVLVDGKACAPLTVRIGAPTSTASATATTTLSRTSTTTTTITTASTSVSVGVSTSTVTTTATIARTTTDSTTHASTAGVTTSSSSSIVSPSKANAVISQEARQLRSSLSAFSRVVLLLQVAAGASVAITVALAVRHYAKKRSSKRVGEPPPQSVTLSR